MQQVGSTCSFIKNNCILPTSFPVWIAGFFICSENKATITYNHLAEVQNVWSFDLTLLLKQNNSPSITTN